MTKDVRKYIIIPEYKPLFAMSKCFGPRKGPLEKPCPTPITVIGELLKQKAPNELTIYEVIKKGTGFSAPVRLTLENYMLTYDEICSGKKKDTPVKMETISTGREAVVPEKIVPGNPAHVVREVSDTVKMPDTVVINTNPPITETPAEEKPVAVVPAVEDSTPAEVPQAEVEPEETEQTEAEEASESKEEASTGAPADVIPDPYAGLSKAERKARRRAERESAENKAATEQ